LRQAKLQLTVILLLVLLCSVPAFARYSWHWSPINRENNIAIATVTESLFSNTYTGGYINGDGGIDDRSMTGGHEDSQFNIEWELLPYMTSLASNHTFMIVYDGLLTCIVKFAVPLTILAVLDIRMVLELRTMRRVLAEMTGTTASVSKQDSSVTLALVIVILVLIVCQVPFLVASLLIMLCNMFHEEDLFGNFLVYYGPVAFLLFVANSAVNFPIYLQFCTKFRVTFYRLICARLAPRTATGVLWRPRSSTANPCHHIRSVVDTHC
jgi:Serpentine type 7TM GPCR chemoreceptor Srw